VTAPALELARRALDLAATDPRAASDAAEQSLAVPDADAEAEAVARRALGLVALYANDLRTASDQLRRAIALADAGRLPRLAAEARMSIAPVLALQGDGGGALAECDRAAAVLTGRARTRLEAQRAALLEMLGRSDEAMAAYQRVVPALHRAGDTIWEARARHNRGLLYLVRGDLARARADLLAADDLMARSGAGAARVHALDHLARLEALAGEIPAALARFAQIDEIIARLDSVDPLGLIDRSAVLLSARLGEEAKAAADLAVEEADRAGSGHYLAEARLARAEACLLIGEPLRAEADAEAAAAAFRRERSRNWAARAGFIAVQARWNEGERSNRLLVTARRSATELDRSGWSDAAAEARLVAGQLALELGRPRTARPELERAARVRGASPAPVRIRAWHATALVRQLDDDRRGVRSALRAGLRIVDAHRATLGATDLRARAAGHGTELAALGLRMALADGSASDVLTWSERFRAGSLQLAPTPPGHDPAVLRDLGELRRLATEIEAAALAGADIAPMRRRQVALEAAVNRLVRTVQGRATALTRAMPVADLADALGGRALLEVVEVDGSLSAVVIGAGRPALASLGPSAAVRTEVDAARFALRRLAFGRGSPAAQAAARDALTESATRLEELLLAPVADTVGDRPLVVVPTGELHVLPWAVLPSLAGRPVTIAPSAALWLDSERAGSSPRRRRRRIALVAGPGLTGAAPEVASLARRYRDRDGAGAGAADVVRLTGRNATASAVKTAIDGAGLAHIAAHGRFRADNPLFSALELADGPLTVHELETLRRAPDTLVLSACDSGLSAVQPGDELLGLAASLLGLGTRTLIASLLPVPDEATRSLMVDVHARLRSGSTPAEALAAAQTAGRASGDDAALAAAASFVCLGHG
jgi:hypothetical protein